MESPDLVGRSCGSVDRVTVPDFGGFISFLWASFIDLRLV